MAKNNQWWKNLLGYNNIYVKTGKEKTVMPGRVTTNRKGDEVIKPVEMSSEAKKAFEFFKSDYLSLLNASTRRLERYRELEFMVYNEGLMFTANSIYADETVQPNEEDRFIIINAKDTKVEKHFYQWLSDIGVNQNVLEAVAWDLTMYGDSFWVNSIDAEKGVTEITPISVYNVLNRIEYSAVMLGEEMEKRQGALTSALNASQSLRNLADFLLDPKASSEYSDNFKSYLFGYELKGHRSVAPWYISHFRRFTTKSEFYPFGRSNFIGSLSRYLSFKNTELLMDMARVSSFPKEVYEIETSEDMTEPETFRKVNQIREMVANITTQTKTPDDISIGEPIFTVKGMFNYNILENRVDLNKIADYDAKREDLILSTGIPQGYLTPGGKGGNWGTSGQNLLQQSKQFARRVFVNQSAILETITELYKTHLLITQEFDSEDTEFELSMSFPVVEESQDRMRVKSDSLRMANDIISNLGQAVGLDRGEALPIDIVKDVFINYSFLDNEDVEYWIDEVEKSREVIEEEVYSKVRKKIKSRPITEKIFKEAYFKTRRENGVSEGVWKKRHFFNSVHKNKVNDIVRDCLKKDLLEIGKVKLKDSKKGRK